MRALIRFLAALTRYAVVIGFLALLGLLIYGFVLPQFHKPRTSFHITAKTEVISGRITESSTKRGAFVYLPNALICHGPLVPRRSGGGHPPCGTVEPPLIGVTGKLSFETGATFEIERVSSGPLYITLKNEQGKPAATLHGENGRQLQSPVVIRIDDPSAKGAEGQSLVIPIWAKDVRIGRDVQFGSIPNAPHLKSGELALLGRGFPSGQIFQAKVQRLDLGDVFSVPPDSDGREPEFSGLVSVTEEPRFSVVFNVTAEQAQVSRFMAEGYRPTITFFDRLVNDQYAEVLWALIAFFGSSGFFYLLFGRTQQVSQSSTRGA